MGDFLFSCVQLARHLGLNPEETLRAANDKFVRRFGRMEALLKESGESFGPLSLEELDVYWNRAKEEESRGKTP